MKRFLIAASIIVGARHCLAQQTVINEVMYAPVKPEPEWIELFNPSDSVISTSGWTISNHLRKYPLLPDTIGPQGYLILTKDSANFLRAKYKIPDVHILQTTLPTLVNTGDDIVVRDSTNMIIDSLKYSPNFGGANGVSLERIDYAAPTDSNNFASSTDSLGGTPGFPNSIRRRDADLAVQKLSYTTENQHDILVTVTIINKGRTVISDGIITLNTNSGLPVSQSQITTPIQPLQSVDVELLWRNADYGRTPMRGVD
ncbi:MAG: lamin tail domain-containing protein [Candidatus Kapaibacterium sp.]